MKTYCPHCGNPNEYSVTKPTKCGKCGKSLSFDVAEPRLTKKINTSINRNIYVGPDEADCVDFDLSGIKIDINQDSESNGKKINKDYIAKENGEITKNNKIQQDKGLREAMLDLFDDSKSKGTLD